MKHFNITTTFSIQVDFTVEARDEISAEKKIKKLLDSQDWFDLLEAKQPSVKKALRKSDVIDGPINVLEYTMIDDSWEA
jgi:hypothetical protein